MRKNVFLCFLFLGLLFCEMIEATESTLQLFPDQEPRSVKLPFPYIQISDEERKELKYIPERFYTVLTPESTTKALVGPLSPCIFIGLRNAENGVTIVFHKHFSNDVKSLIQIAQTELKVQDPKNLQGWLFTNHKPSYDTPVKTSSGLSSFRTLHGGKTQLEELKFIKDSLIEAFKIADRTQIKAQKYLSALSHYELGEYELAELSVCIDAGFNLKSICAMHEKFPADYSNIPLYSRTTATIQAVQRLTQELLEKHFAGKVTTLELNTYNTVHFERL